MSAIYAVSRAAPVPVRAREPFHLESVQGLLDDLVKEMTGCRRSVEIVPRGDGDDAFIIAMEITSGRTLQLPAPHLTISLGTFLRIVRFALHDWNGAS